MRYSEAIRRLGIEAMKVIKVGRCRVEVAFCNLRCPYCVHLFQEHRDLSVDEIVEKLGECESVYIGGAEPTVQKKELKQLLEKLYHNGKSITLKTDGMLPDVIEELLQFVSKFVFELKAEFDDTDNLSKLTGLDRERAAKYAGNLLKSIEIARKREKKIKLWIRVIPGFVTKQSLEKALERVGKVNEIMLYQFLSNPKWDRESGEFSEFKIKKPDFEYLIKLADIAVNFAERVVLTGEKRVVLEGGGRKEKVIGEQVIK